MKKNTRRKFNIWGLIIAILGAVTFRLAYKLFHEVNGLLGIMLVAISLVLIVFGGCTLFIKKGGENER